MLFQRSTAAAGLSRLAAEHQIYLGTSSWKFPGWCGMLYDEDRYLWGTHFSKARFSRASLEEYARVFKTVCVDATYYRCPSADYLQRLAAQVPEDFKFTFKVPDDVTIKTFPNVKTFGRRQGKPNPYFLSPGFFVFGLLRNLEKIQPKVGMLVFEFSHFHPSDFEHGRDFVTALDAFFREVPEGWQYGVEVRNRNLLHPEYFDMLRSHGVAHVYNQWTLMPPVSEQLEMRPALENPFVAARYLLTPHRSLDWAEREFAPFNQVKEIDPDARDSLRRIIEDLIDHPDEDRPPSFLFVGNHLEGNALHTIADVLVNLPLTPQSDDALGKARA